jgi:hypothetical protein
MNFSLPHKYGLLFCGKQYPIGGNSKKNIFLLKMKDRCVEFTSIIII